MADAVLETSTKSGILSKYLPLAKETYDPLMPHAHMMRQVESITGDHSRVDILSTFSAGNVQVIRLPQSFYLNEVYIKATLGAPAAGTYSSYPGLNMINRVVLRHAETLQEFSYQPVMQYVLGEMTDEKKNLILQMAGGATPGACSVVIPLPLFFSSLLAGPDDSPNVPMFALAAPLELEITWNSGAALCAAGGTVPAGALVTAMQLVTVQRKCSSTLMAAHRRMIEAGAWVYPYIDFQTKVSGVTVATATPTTINLDELEGTLAFIQMQPHLTSNITTAHNYYILGEVDSFKLMVEGSEYDRIDTQLEYGYESLLKGFRTGKSALAVVGATDPIAICFGGHKVEEYHSFAGSLNVANINSLTLNVTHTLGASGEIYIACGKYALWRIRPDGYMVREK